MKKSYVIFWSIITIIVLSVIYLKNSFIPKQIKTAVTVSQVASKIINNPKLITKADILTIGNAIVTASNPLSSFIPPTNPKDSLIPLATHRIYFGIEKPLDNSPYFSKVTYFHRLGKSNFYLGGGLSVPITKDSLLNKSKISIGIEWEK